MLMAAWNGIPWIEEQIDSILVQMNIEISLYVSVDPSTDGTEDYVFTRAQNDNRVNLLSTKERFGCAARNFYRLLRDVDISRFDYIALADQDDYWEPDKLYRACTALVQNKAVAYSGTVTAFWPNGREKKLKKAQPQRELDFLFEAAGPGCTYVFERDFALELQSFLQANTAKMEQILAHDWFFYAFCRSRGHRWFIDTQSFVRYRQHAGNELGANCGCSGMRRRIDMLCSGWYFNQIHHIAVMCNMRNIPALEHVMSQNWRHRVLAVSQIHKFRRRFLDRLLLALLILSGRLQSNLNEIKT